MRLYFFPQARHFRFFGRVSPQRHTQPILLAGLPTMSANAGVLRQDGTSPDEGILPTVIPQTRVALAPTVAPRFTSVGAARPFTDLGARVVHVGKHHGRAAEDPVLQSHPL